MQLVFCPAAREEAREAYLHLAEADEELAIDFERQLRLALRAIEKNPEACRIRRFAVRRKNLSRFKRHYVAYMLWQEQIVIIAIGHASCRPYYWYRRPKNFRDNSPG
jgi:plasmid stabilization system protein ParE